MLDGVSFNRLNPNSRSAEFGLDQDQYNQQTNSFSAIPEEKLFMVGRSKRLYFNRITFSSLSLIAHTPLSDRPGRRFLDSLSAPRSGANSVSPSWVRCTSMTKHSTSTKLRSYRPAQCHFLTRHGCGMRCLGLSCPRRRSCWSNLWSRTVPTSLISLVARVVVASSFCTAALVLARFSSLHSPTDPDPPGAQMNLRRPGVRPEELIYSLLVLVLVLLSYNLNLWSRR